MGLKQWLLGTTDGVNFVISTDAGDMPEKGTIVRVEQAPTKNQVDTLVNSGCNVRVITPPPASAGGRSGENNAAR